VVHRAAIDAAGHCYFTGDFDGNAVFGGTNLTSYGGTDIFLGRLGSEIFPPLRLALNITNGIAAIDFSGAPGSIIYLEAARILNGAWSGLTNFALPATVLRWMDAESPDDAQRFYRARLVP
jgi:hypothetical protein